MTNQSNDTDAALLIIAAPLYICAFCVLIAWGAWNDVRDRRRRG